jgi:GDPmannose 4,6-dehydratase
MTKRALITGITGQDGSYLAELLLDKGYEVIGMVRRSSTVNFERIAHFQDKVTLVPGDLLDEVSIIHILREHRPAEVYNLAAQSFVQTSFGQPVLTGEITALGVTRLLDAIRIVDPDIRFYQASTSEMFGKVQEVPQTEDTPFYPRSPTAWPSSTATGSRSTTARATRSTPARGSCSTTRAPGAATSSSPARSPTPSPRSSSGQATELRLGNLDAQRDWGFAGDYVDAMYRMLQADEPDDFVIATGRTHTVREFCRIAFEHVGLNYEDHVVVDQKFFRPAEVDLLIGDPTKAKEKLGWEPEDLLEDWSR